MSDSIGTTGVIPARGGSKDLPGKNLYPLLGKPLIQYTIEAARAAGLDRVVVSSDSAEILDCAAGLGAQALIRPAHLATDTASTDATVAQLIEALALPPSEELVLLQPTSPQRSIADIGRALDQFRHERTPLISFEPVDNGCLKNYVLVDGMPMPLFELRTHRRQDLPTVLRPNGALYIFTVAQFRENHAIPRHPVTPFLMPPERSIDIDTLADIRRVEALLKETDHG